MSTYKRPQSEPIAIVGTGCRFAGDVTSPTKLWDLLTNPRQLSQEVPNNRFNAQGFYHPDGEYHGATNATQGYFLEEDHRVWDAGFFNITPKEAEAIDPQQRIILEVVYEALESAGYTLEKYAGKKVAVYAGLMTQDYDSLCQRDDITSNQYFATGNSRAILSNRISYFFNFRGPSMTIDTACSSSLVALHQAVLSLRSGECEMACVAGANLMITPEQFISEASLHMLSPTGTSKMWDVSADGYARGEGFAALFIKPLSQALRDGDSIISIVRETGVNSDGRTQGITMPSPLAQAELIRDTYRRSGLDSQNPIDRPQYFEAHGTGTQAGDPREAQAISTAFFGNEAKTTAESVDNKLVVGSIKTVIGHTEGAAGLAGLLKVVHSMINNCIPPNLHLNTLNPSVKPFYGHLRIPVDIVPWPQAPTGQPLRGSVNSFGFGGTNSHAIIERYEPSIHDEVAKHFAPALETPVPSLTTTSSYDAEAPAVGLPLVISAKSQKSLVAVAQALRDFMVSTDKSADEVAYNLYAHRSALTYRTAISADSRDGVIAALDNLLSKAGSSSNPELGVRAKLDGGEVKILGIFTGQGAQWSGMGRKLFHSSSVYRNTIENLERVLEACPHPPTWSLIEELIHQEDSSRINIAALSQPLCTAVQIALIDLLGSINVSFHTVVGHSSGEIGAAYAAGVLSARDAMLISYYRGMSAHLAGGKDGQKGMMMAVGMTRAEASALCARDDIKGRIWVAASNAPSSVTLSGDVDAVKALQVELTEEKKFARLLVVDTAYHSAHMERPAAQYMEDLAGCGIEPRQRNSTVWISSVYADGTEPSIEELKGPYWKDNMVKAVSFYEAIDLALNSQGPFASAVEVGPHPALKGPVQQTVKAATGGALSYAGLLDRKKDDRHAFAEFLGFTWNYFGTDAIDWNLLVAQSTQPGLSSSRLELPSYPWDHSQMHYRESRIAHQYHFRERGPHELLGVRTRDDTEFEMRWRNILKLETVPWIQHHKFQGQALLPASAYCVLALDAAKAVLNGREASVVELTDLEFMSGISLEANTYGVEILVSLSIAPPSTKGRLAGKIIEGVFTITSCYADGVTPMQKNFTGNLRIYLGEPSEDALPTRDPSMAETLPADTDSFYQMMLDIGLDYTGPFRALQSIDRRYNFCSATLQKFHGTDTTVLGVSPATLDSCFHSVFAAVASPGDKSLWTSFLPRSIEKIRFNLALCDGKPADNASLLVDSVITQEIPRTKTATTKFVGDMSIYNPDGEMEIQVEGLMVASFANSKPEDDKELYLTTVCDLDPEHEIIAADLSQEDVATERILLEACERVARFYIHDDSLKDLSSSPVFFTPPATPMSPPKARPSEASPSPWQQDTAELLDAYILQSPFQHALSFIRLLGENIPDVLPAMLSTIIQEAKQLHRFRSHVSRVVSQLAHRYPRMRVLGLTDPETALTKHVIEGFKGSFVSYTLGNETEPDLLARVSSDAIKKKIDTEHTKILDNEDSSSLQPFDLVVLTTSIVKGAEQRSKLKQVQSLMKPGGFLILIHESMSPLRDRLRRAFGVRRQADLPLTPPEWPDLLDECGFARVSKNAEQFFAPDFSLIVRQAESDIKHAALSPLNSSVPKVMGHTLIIGAQENTADLSAEVHQKLGPLCSSIDIIADLDSLQPAIFNEIGSVIFLADLDEPMMSSMTPERLDLFRALMAPEKVVLWVTMNSRAGNPEHAATFGFCRSMLAEIPSLKLQMLDLDSRRDSSDLVAETFLRLSMKALHSAAQDGKLLWSHENEIFMEHGKRLIPRLLPWKEGNDRVNCPRRLVADEANTLKQCVEVISAQSGDGSAVYTANIVEETDIDDAVAIPDQSVIQVKYSSVEVINFGLKYASHVCIGKEVTSGELCLAMTKSNSSYVTVPNSCVFQLSSSNIEPKLLLGLVLRYLVALSVAEDMMEQTVLLLEPDVALLECMKEVFEAKGANVIACTTSGSKRKSFGQRYIHPYASNRQLKALFPADGASVIDFLPEGSELSETILDCLPENCEYHSRFSLLTSEHVVALGDSMDIEHLWETAIGKAITNVRSMNGRIGYPTLDTISVPQLLDHTGSSKPFQILDWRAEREVQHIAKPLFGTQLLRPYKTYVLVGLTRDMGQSLCNLFFEHGARHIVLASRNPNMQPQWIEDLSNKGCEVRIERLDVTSIESVRAFKQRLAQEMPPVAGVINGAMVLDDRVFAQMDVETWNRVMRPKTVGSSNLDEIFCEADMEFFIMTSSFAAPGGHGGQSNYAAANMYMNGLAANRRIRGLAGSVLNIGVIYGLGLLHRERTDIYAFLEKDGYPPISERDIHHMFLEAIVAGRPLDGQIYDITTGLSRYNANREDKLHWQIDPRFSHFTFEDDDEGNEGEGQGKQSLKEKIKTVEGGTEEVAAVLTEGFARYLEVVLGQGEGSVKGEHSVGELGMDSLVAVEVRGWFWKVIERDVSVMKILGSASVAKLCLEIADGYIKEKNKA
ncbi:beta-ketoacyl synthase domain-containing protein [Colletotrichum phormii]|uniref:Beta-ketoacyl synthase domain-containing protein n=1 Tax=Colletotrichum phormii TaxID=359342 RepID=A0AAJ0E961_9PEZI|nr:beta-ketoacyl synthase domain-containing protein [Colletotrichum phormii]KAK1622425.1 beta-ketoacyl synthase domain-containing protein [Colletotrichum phormii]